MNHNQDKKACFVIFIPTRAFGFRLHLRGVEMLNFTAQKISSDSEQENKKSSRNKIINK